MARGGRPHIALAVVAHVLRPAVRVVHLGRSAPANAAGAVHALAVLARQPHRAHGDDAHEEEGGGGAEGRHPSKGEDATWQREEEAHDGERHLTSVLSGGRHVIGRQLSAGVSRIGVGKTATTVTVVSARILPIRRSEAIRSNQSVTVVSARTPSWLMPIAARADLIRGVAASLITMR